MITYICCKRGGNNCPKREECRRYINADIGVAWNLFKYMCTENDNYQLFMEREETTESSESAETTEISETTDSAEQTGTDDNTDTTEKTEEQKTKTSSGSGKSKSSGTNKGKSSSSTKGKNGSTETEESETVTTAKLPSSLQERLTVSFSGEALTALSTRL